MPHQPRRPVRARLLLLAIPATLALATPAHAAPGLGEEVYAATVEPGELELETRYGVLTGGPGQGADNYRLEAGYGIDGHVRVAVVGEWEKDAGGPRQFTHAGVEAVYHVARIGGVDIAAYGEYELGFHGESDGVEAKLLLQHRTRLWDLRFNLIAEKPLDSTRPTEFGYATSADVAVTDNLRLGATAFGELGTGRRLFAYGAHFVGPGAKLKLPLASHNLRIDTGYLFAIAQARSDSQGQFRLNIELEL